MLSSYVIGRIIFGANEVGKCNMSNERFVWRWLTAHWSTGPSKHPIPQNCARLAFYVPEAENDCMLCVNFHRCSQTCTKSPSFTSLIKEATAAFIVTVLSPEVDKIVNKSRSGINIALFTPYCIIFSSTVSSSHGSVAKALDFYPAKLASSHDLTHTSC